MTSSPPASRKLRILLAEDDFEVRHSLARLLAFDGYDVQCVATGGELLDVLAGAILDDPSGAPMDLIITDMRMPGFNGLAIVEGLRANGWRHPVIVISAFGDTTTRDRVRRLGRAEFFPKPFDPAGLERAIEELARR
jgi:DNA-binding response OmpR family regulator